MTNFKYAEFDVPGTNLRGVCCIDITKNTRVKYSVVNGVEYITHTWQLKNGHPEYAHWPVKNSFNTKQEGLAYKKMQMDRAKAEGKEIVNTFDFENLHVKG
jgi:hypothetical protein